jgi:hypothetical protein
MENKQTAVEWLVEQLLKKSNIQYINSFDDLVEQAKEMEKQHVMNFLEEYDSYIFRGGNTSEEEYYDYIYGN